jgi:hypothetical protein
MVKRVHQDDGVPGARDRRRAGEPETWRAIADYMQELDAEKSNDLHQGLVYLVDCSFRG